MKAVLISVQPKWCQLIASGKKTVEVRKTRPKIDVPFKVYIYCTKAREKFVHGGIVDTLDDLYRMPDGEIKFGYSGELMCCDEEHGADNFLNGKVIGEFVCDAIIADKTFGHNTLFKTSACMSDADVSAYCLNKEMYCWHISDLVIYDKPMAISDFIKSGALCYDDWLYGIYDGSQGERLSYDCYLEQYRLKEAPQSWCYVEKRETGGIQT